MFSLRTKKLNSKVWLNIIPNYDNEIFSILNDDHSYFLGDTDYRPEKYCNQRDKFCIRPNFCLERDIIYDEISKRKIYTDEEIYNAAKIIQRNWQRFMFRRLYFFLRGMIYRLLKEDPVKLLKRTNTVQAQLFEKTCGNHLVFRLAGETFPPMIVYKVFTSQFIINVYGEGKLNNSNNNNNNMKKNSCKKKTCKTKLMKTQNEWKPFYIYRKAIKYPSKADSKLKCRPSTPKTPDKKWKRTSLKWINEVYDIQ